MKLSDYQALIAKQPKKKSNEEDKLQASFVTWFRTTYLPYADLLLAIPNGGKRNIITAVNLKRTGVLAGVPDTLLAVPRNSKNGLFIEFKIEGGKVSPKQENIIRQLREQGYQVEIAWNLEQAQQIIKEYLR